MTTSFTLHLVATALVSTALTFVLCQMFHDIAGSDDDMGDGA